MAIDAVKCSLSLLLMIYTKAHMDDNCQTET
jgi:hypothetical protein